VALLAAGCVGDEGAVSLRWRLVDLSTGNILDVKGYDTPDPPFVHACVNLPRWKIDTIHLRIATLDGNVLTFADAMQYPCAQGEATTPFDIPPGTYALSLQAEAGGGEVGVAPAPLVRQVERGQVVNLELIEVGIGSDAAVASVDLGADEDAGSPP
jgi:hypothetical protein